MPAYLDIAGFKDLSSMPSSHVDELVAMAPAYLEAQLEMQSAWIDSRLAKRYAVPFHPPYPLAVRMWLARIVTPRAMQRRGVNATDEQYIDIRDDAQRAEEEVREAADAVQGLFDLPLRADTNASGISRGGPITYSEASPYVWRDGQARAGRREDRHGGGSRRG